MKIGAIYQGIFGHDFMFLGPSDARMCHDLLLFANGARHYYIAGRLEELLEGGKIHEV